MKYSPWLLTTTVVAVALLANSSVFAARQAGPCREDAQKFCAGVAPKGGGMAKCLKEHENDLSDACKAKIQGMRDQAEAVKTACAEDINKNCSGMKPGKGKLMSCLKEHEATLSEACKAELHKNK